MDIDKEGWDTNDLWRLDELKKVCKAIGPELKELVIRIPKWSMVRMPSVTSVSSILNGTFRLPSLPRLEGVVVVLETQSSVDAKLIQDDLVKGGIFLATRLECNTNDISKGGVALLVTEGKEFGCKCHWRHKNDPGYLIRYFGEYLRSCEYIHSDA